MVDPRIAARNIAAARKVGTDARPNPQQDEVLDMPSVLLGYIRQAQIERAMRS